MESFSGLGLLSSSGTPSGSLLLSLATARASSRPGMTSSSRFAGSAFCSPSSSCSLLCSSTTDSPLGSPQFSLSGTHGFFGFWPTSEDLRSGDESPVSILCGLSEAGVLEVAPSDGGVGVGAGP